jgi:signal transduction histidine kinase
MPELIGVFRNRERRRRLADPAYDAMHLDASRTFRVRTRPVALSRRLRWVVETVAIERDAEVVLHVPQDLRAVVDVDALDRIAANVILNALRYGKPPVTVSARVRNGVLLISFEDCGRGVASEFVPHLFKRGARSEASQRDANGSGVGLTLSRFYARVLGGDLVYHGRAGDGARFTVLLPRTPTVHEQPTLDRIKAFIRVPVESATARLNTCERIALRALDRRLAVEALRK